MNMLSVRLACVVVGLFTSFALSAQHSPYVGQQNREVKALSEEELNNLKSGYGMGLAKAAELNGYPGPAHALELSADLGLNAEQIAALTRVKAQMTAHARTTGAAIIDEERALDRLFTSGTADRAAVSQVTQNIARLQGELRAIHLNAHIETRRLFRPEQVQQYVRLRGYNGKEDTGHGTHTHR